jgi:ubiquinone biosynthesis protein
VKDNAPDRLRRAFRGKGGDDLTRLTQEQRIRMAAAELGTTFIKLGQLMSTRTDLIGPELAEELTHLQSRTPPDPPEVVREIVESELGATLEESFADFDLEALASASIGQVHRARLHSGEDVVVKVRHRGIDETTGRDLVILRDLAVIADRSSEEIRQYRPIEQVEQFGRTLNKELDFEHEKRNLLRFRKNFGDDRGIRIPEAFEELSSNGVLTMECIEGFNVKDAERLDQAGIDRSQFAERVARMFLDMMFRDRFYHADPHPGNILVLESGEIGLLDCGMVGILDDHTASEIEEILGGLLGKDARKISAACARICETPPDFDPAQFTASVDEFIAENIPEEMRELNVQAVLEGMIEIIRRFGLVLPTNISLLLRVMIMLEGTVRALDPDINFPALLQPYYRRTVLRKLSPDYVLRRLYRSWEEWDRLLDALPRGLTDLLERSNRGTFRVQLEHRRLDALINRLVYGVLVASLFLGSSLMWSFKVPPLYKSYSIVGAGGVLVAVVLGVRLIRAIWKSGYLEERKK